MYQELLEMERKLDWTVMRKKVEIEDALTRVQPVRQLCSLHLWTAFLLFCYAQVPRTLRIFLSHTVSGQVWQQPETGDPSYNFDTGQGIPAWQLKIEGRVLEVSAGLAKSGVSCSDNAVASRTTSERPASASKILSACEANGC